ncbi:uncharacterized protein LOC110814113 [Carica papaya]|uniref:uncharacterized protein LOC110814113 n=1 Tax=Carica papaya TaxID=3649 RepID=UPI000B8CA9CD|nr:uncharacterized protein LOC110814113 [Carica papaya]
MEEIKAAFPTRLPTIKTYEGTQTHLNEKQKMEIESAQCECCGLEEDCTRDYISEVKAKFGGKWLCGLCSEAVIDEVGRRSKKLPSAMEEAVKAHFSFCGKFRSNPAVQVADGMRQMLRRRSGDLSFSSSSSSSSASSSKKYTRSSSTRLC